MDLWTSLIEELLWPSAVAVVPVAVVAALACRFLPLKPATRHALWVVALAWFAAPFLAPAHSGDTARHSAAAAWNAVRDAAGAGVESIRSAAVRLRPLLSAASQSDEAAGARISIAPWNQQPVASSAGRVASPAAIARRAWPAGADRTSRNIPDVRDNPSVSARSSGRSQQTGAPQARAARGIDRADQPKSRTPTPPWTVGRAGADSSKWLASTSESAGPPSPFTGRPVVLPPRGDSRILHAGIVPSWYSVDRPTLLVPDARSASGANEWTADRARLVRNENSVALSPVARAVPELQSGSRIAAPADSQPRIVCVQPPAGAAGPAAQRSFAPGPTVAIRPQTETPLAAHAVPDCDSAAAVTARPATSAAHPVASSEVDSVDSAAGATGASSGRAWLVGLAGVRDALVGLPPLPGAVWAAGIACFALVGCARALLFRRRLRNAAPAPAHIQRAVQRVAQRMKLRRAPDVRMVDGRVSPMIWWGGRVRLLLPTDLWDQLDPVGREAVLCHELAHLRRGDHWVGRWEFLIACLYWWHPLVWWIRRRLHEEAELSCDSWVTWLLPHGRREYAEALLTAQQFVDERFGPSPGLGRGVISRRARPIARRITMVMTGNARPRFSLTGVALTAALAAAGWMSSAVWACPPKHDARARAYETARAAWGDAADSARAAWDDVLQFVAAPGEPTSPAPVTAAEAPVPAVAALAMHDPDDDLDVEDDEDNDTDRGGRGGRGDGVSLERRLERLERQLERLEKSLNRLPRGQQPAPMAFTVPPTPPGRPSAGAPAPGGPGSGRFYKIEGGKLKALGALLIRNDVPLRVRLRENGIEVFGDEAQQQSFRRFVEVLLDAGKEKRTFRLPPEKLELLGNLMSRDDVQVQVHIGPDAITFNGTAFEMEAAADFIQLIQGADDRGAQAPRSPRAGRAPRAPAPPTPPAEEARPGKPGRAPHAMGHTWDARKWRAFADQLRGESGRIEQQARRQVEEQLRAHRRQYEQARRGAAVHQRERARFEREMARMQQAAEEMAVQAEAVRQQAQSTGGEPGRRDRARDLKRKVEELKAKERELRDRARELRDKARSALDAESRAEREAEAQEQRTERCEGLGGELTEALREASEHLAAELPDALSAELEGALAELREARLPEGVAEALELSQEQLRQELQGALAHALDAVRAAGDQAAAGLDAQQARDALREASRQLRGEVREQLNQAMREAAEAVRQAHPALDETDAVLEVEDSEDDSDGPDANAGRHDDDCRLGARLAALASALDDQALPGVEAAVESAAIALDSVADSIASLAMMPGLPMDLIPPPDEMDGPPCDGVPETVEAPEADEAPELDEAPDAPDSDEADSDAEDAHALDDGDLSSQLLQLH